MTSRAWSMIMSAIGHAAVVIVRSTRTASALTSIAVDEAEIDDVHPRLGIVDLAQRFAHRFVIGHRDRRLLHLEDGSAANESRLLVELPHERQPLRRR